MMKSFVVTIFYCFLLLTVFTANAQTFKDLPKEDIWYVKSFPLLFILEHTAPVYRTEPAGIKKIRNRLEQDARTLIKKGSEDTSNSTALQFTDAEIAAIGDELVKLTLTNALDDIIKVFRVTGYYALYNEDADTTLIRKAWQQDARGVNHILSVYIDGQAPLYAKIDAMSFQKNDPVFRDSIAACIKRILGKGNTNRYFFKIPVQLAMDALRLNGRDEAVRYEPILHGQNQAAYDVVKTTKWNSFPYSVIMVPGLGPEQPGVALDPGGAKRCDSAAARYRAGMAPFIVVSGGHVHPNKTPYCEAVEMKKYLVNVLHIPEAVVIIEPHARHTTTNIRNTNRIILQFKMPVEKPVLIVTDAAQNNYINGVLRDRLIKELGYVPYNSMKKLSPIETEYIPLNNCRQVNSMEPLDP